MAFPPSFSLLYFLVVLLLIFVAIETFGEIEGNMHCAERCARVGEEMRKEPFGSYRFCENLLRSLRHRFLTFEIRLGLHVYLGASYLLILTSQPISGCR